ncbi:MAG: DUF1501 domain-containing protein [Planctomycetota bacterium]
MNSLFSGVSRREALTRSVFGLGGLALASVLQDDGVLAADDASGSASGTHFAPRAKRVIQVFAGGGPSHVDTLDPKPDLAKYDNQLVKDVDPDYHQNLPEVASGMGRLSGKFFGSPFRFEKHGESGLEISELFPHLAKHADDLCVIRSMQTTSSVHELAQAMTFTGSFAFVRPCIGSWTVYGLGSANRNLPAFVSMGGSSRSAANVFLPAATAGTRLNAKAGASADEMLNHLRSQTTSLREQRRQLDLLRVMNADHLKERAGDAWLEGRIEAFETAFRMQVEASEAFDIAREPKQVRELYGDTEQGAKLLLARRLAERGVRYVQVMHNGWDTHEDNDNRHRKLCAEADQPLAALLEDLKQRDLLKDTLVIWGGEFGRTPTTDINGVRKIRGRDHNAGGYSIWMAGGGVKGGHVHGSTDRFGAVATEGRMEIHDLHATVLGLLGLDHEKLTFRHASRDYRLTDVHGRVFEEIFA